MPKPPISHELAGSGEAAAIDKVVAIVLCGGLGTRLKSLTGKDVPKPLYPIVDKPIIEHSIDPLIQGGIGKIVLATAYKDHAIRKHFEEEYQFPSESPTTIDFANQREPTGVLPAVTLALKQHESSITDAVIVCDGDAIRRGLDVSALYDFHRSAKRNTTLVTTSVSYTERHWGIIGDDNRDLVKIDPFPATGTIPENVVFTGCMMLDNTGVSILRDIPSPDSSWAGMATLLQENGSINHYYSEMDYFNLNSPDIVEDAIQTLSGIGRVGISGY